MTQDEYILGLFMIVSGLAITHLLGELHHLFMARKRVKWFWVHSLTVFSAVYMIVFSWFVSWNSFSGVEDGMPLWGFLMVFLQLTLLFLMARVALPENIPDEGIDLKEYYFSIRRYYWLLVGLVPALHLLDIWVVIPAWTPDSSPSLEESLNPLVTASIGAALCLIKRPIVHMIVVPAWLVIFVAGTINLHF